jgi:hypothetical protein
MNNETHKERICNANENLISILIYVFLPSVVFNFSHIKAQVTNALSALHVSTVI